MKNTYLTSHFPLISILLFSTSFALFTETYIVNQLKELGLYEGMREFFSDSGIKLTLLFLAMLFFFMVFSALKLIADTINELSMLFFSKDEEGNELKKIRGGSWIFLVASLTSLAFISYPLGIVLLLCLSCFVYFVYFVYKVNESLSGAGLVGFIFFQVIFWFSFLLAVIYACLKLYNSFMASLPL
ncbi:YufK family protein [Halalkalibacterium ligniniphilum]|uniref:YufK family protein n=1 Tax=Halalkalibacterium ligniniphilum TaxID=1134413 RepID=UPI000348DBDE|nr:YufK family protein [Halalkalibacterium ligniniphilum]